MNKVQSYIRELDSYNIYLDELYKYMGNVDTEEVDDDLTFLLETLYPEYKVYNNKKERMEQKEFREKLLKIYKSCVITGMTCIAELEACHIVPYSKDSHNNSVDNGLILKVNIHKTFDMGYWTINPDTMEICVKDHIDAGEIMEYKGRKVKLDCNDKLIANLRKRFVGF